MIEALPQTEPDPVLKDVPGPTALGGGWRRSLELLYTIAVFDFKKTYFGTALGYLWSLGRPLLLFAVLLEVFTKVVRFGTVPHYPELLLMNIVLFGLFQEVTITSVSSVVSQEAVVRKTQFPRLIIPLAVVLTGVFNLALNLVVVVVFLIGAGIEPRLSWLLFPVVLILLLGITTAWAMILSSLYPRFRDVSIIWTVFTTALFYATPVLYPLSAVQNHQTLRELILLNPLTPVFELARKWMVSPSAPSPVAAAGGVLELAGPIAIYAAICILAVWVFRREAPRIAEEL